MTGIVATNVIVKFVDIESLHQLCWRIVAPSTKPAKDKNGVITSN
jgi:hypothetical protein